MTTRDTDWDGVRLHVVTGKGGTGKTTVAAALALALTRLGVVDFATTIAPGLSDVLVTGKATEAARRRVSRRDDSHVYHAVVMDAPPTGRISRFLDVSTEIAELAKVGPIKTHSDTVA